MNMMYRRAALWEEMRHHAWRDSIGLVLLSQSSLAGSAPRADQPEDFFRNLLTGLGGIEREKLLRLHDPAQRVAADRYEPAAHAVDIGEGLRDQHRLLDRPAHGGDPAGLVDGRPAHGEIVAFVDADITGEHLA